MSCDLKRMSPQQYKKWLQDDRKKDASLPSFFPSGEKRTLNVLKGDAKPSSVKRWNSFVTRHSASYCRNPTYRQAIALRNWGIAINLKKVKQ